MNLSGVQAPATGQSVKTPKETEIPQEIASIVEALKQRIKENRELSEQIASVDPKLLEQLDRNYNSALVAYGKTLNGVQREVQETKILEAESRRDLLDGEMAQRFQTNATTAFDYTGPINFLYRLAGNYEKMIQAYSEELRRLEKLIFGQQKPVTPEQIAAHLKRVDSAFRYMSGQVFEMDEKMQELKSLFKNYRHSMYGDSARYFSSKPRPASSSLRQFDRIEGPNPFSMSSPNATLVIANALSRAQAGTGLAPAPNIGFSATQPSFVTQPLLGFGAQQPIQPFSTTQTLFRPFGASTAASTVVTSATPFATGTLSFASPFGSTTTAATTTAAATTASPWRFSSPFNTSSTGTLFGGTATNVGAVKPLGLATPLQQTGTPAATSLQLLNPPLGTR